MRELSLFTGGGGGIWGSKLLGWSTVGYVEWEPYCQKIISQRITDGIFDRAPIFGDIRAFISEGYAESYQGMVDVVTAGFPCQPYSRAGKGHGRHDDRNLWPETASTIRIIKPRYALLENVVTLSRYEYFTDIIEELTAMGYDCQWTNISAAEVGAPHSRQRLWILADADRRGCNATREYESVGGVDRSKKDHMLQIEECRRRWIPEPNVGRVANGVAARLNRLRALGNGQVPRVFVEAWKRLAHNTPRGCKV